MKQQQIRGLRNKGVCSLKDIREVASAIRPQKYTYAESLARYRARDAQRRLASKRARTEVANNPVSNPVKKANLDALRASWAKIKNTSNEV